MFYFTNKIVWIMFFKNVFRILFDRFTVWLNIARLQTKDFKRHCGTSCVGGGVYNRIMIRSK